jgi:putative molybdopterin biosynthesis protein
MSLYLRDIPLVEAIKILENALVDANLWRVLGNEILPVDENALGRVLAFPLQAKNSSPGYNSSAMDGFVVRAKETQGATLSAPKSLDYGSQSIYVDTGDPIPYGFDAVVPIEEVESLDAFEKNSKDPRRPKFIRLRSATVPWKNIRSLGEDITIEQLIFVAGHIIRPVDLGVIAAAGFSEIEVARKPRVAILPTGSELVPIGRKPEKGEILEFNSLILAGKINEWGGVATRYPIIKDNFEEILKEVISAAAKHDLILINAGSSAGSEDFTAKVVQEAGKLLLHGVAVRPGHPVIIGMINRQTQSVPVIGVPGYPVSAALTLDIFVKKIMFKWLGIHQKEEEKISAKLTRKVISPSGDDDYVRVVLSKVGDEVLAAPLSKGAGVITSLSMADGLLVIPSGVQGLEEGKKVEITLLRNRSEIDQTILCIGSHDLILEKIMDFLSRLDRRFVSINVGSMGGLIALNRGESHMAGSHLLDPATGDYNFYYIRKFVSNISVRVVALAMREQGLLVKNDNPKAIKSLNDILRKDIKFINRQKGSGTRVLLDYHLNLNDINPLIITGYEQEEYTHLGVAAAVASGRVDCGLGIAAAALPYGLDFIPLFTERYDLIINQKFAESELINPLYQVMESLDFKQAISELSGYKLEVMGKTMLENN